MRIDEWKSLAGKTIVEVESEWVGFGVLTKLKLSDGSVLVIDKGDAGTIRDPEPYFDVRLKRAGQ